MNKPPIPKMPRSLKRLKELSGKHFKILFQEEEIVVPGRRVYESSLVLKCPFCLMEFSAISNYSCFGETVSPSNCPNCDFPHNVLAVFIKKCQEKRKTKPRV